MNPIKNVVYTPDPVALGDQIHAMYAPAENAATADELVSGLDLLELLREVDPDIMPKHVYDAMVTAGFVPQYVEGHVYWPVLLM